ncbi:alpha/beta hydrolase [Phenylobacterium sp.]|uniref:alpha/beta hydrolase n=1 Tax=Phenylobacterium sp. TaxID=1871053 RepID=UPI002F95D85B
MSAIDEGLFAPIRGEEQWVTIRGRDRGNPVVMILGGAGAGLSALAPLFAPWEAEWTVAQWDQPGAGWTVAKNGPPAELSFDRIAADGLAAVEHVLQRLGAEKLVLFCLSGGSIPGLKMIKARPDLFAAYVAQGQVTSWSRMEALSYRMLLGQARGRGDAAAVADLEGIGPPPWSDVTADAVHGTYANAFTPAEAAAAPAELWATVRSPPRDAAWRPRDLAPVDPYATSLEAFGRLKPELAAFDAESLGLTFDVPMLFFQGQQDHHTPAEEVEAYAAKLHAPLVRYIPLPEAGHSAIFMADRMLALLNEHVSALA